MAPNELLNDDTGNSVAARLLAPMVSLQISQSNEGTLEVEVIDEGGLGDKVLKYSADSVSIDEDVADFISELELNDNSPDCLLPSQDESAHEANLDSVKKNLDDDFSTSSSTRGGGDELDCDFSEITECYSAITEKMCNMTSEELRHMDASYTPSSGFTLRNYTKLPEITEDQVLVRVDATSISTRDCLERIRRDNSEGLLHEAFVPGYEIVGRVEQTGSNARHLLHKRVAALLPSGGGCSRYVCVHSKDLIRLPVSHFPSSSQELVNLLSSYMAAYQCLERAVSDIDQTCCVGTDLMRCDSDDFGPSRPLSGSCVLINGAGSPMGLALVEFAQYAGANVYALSHSSHEHSIRSMGITGWFPLCKKNEWKAEWGGKMNLIIDTIGDYDMFSYFYDIMASAGRLLRMNTTPCEKRSAPMQGGYTEECFSLWDDVKGRSLNRSAIDYDIFDSFHKDKEDFAKDFAFVHLLFKTGRIARNFSSRAGVGLDMVNKEWDKAMEGGTNQAGAVIVSP